MQKYYKSSRIAVVAVLILLVLGIYLATLYKLQLFDKGGAENAYLARNTTKQTTILTAARGDILDRNGIVLVSSRVSYNVSLSRDALLDSGDPNKTILDLIHAAISNGITYTDTFPVTAGAPFTYDSDMTKTQKDRLTAFLSYIKADPNISASDLIVKLKERYGIDYTTNINDARLVIGVRYELEMRLVKSMNPYVFAYDVSVDFLSMIKEQKYPGVNIETSSKRVYNTTYAAHLLGYIGLMDKEEYDSKYNTLGYSYSAMVGKSGAEFAFEQYLHGTDGKQVTTTSNNGTVLNVQTTKEPVPGNNVFLSIDIGLQAVCEDALAAKIDLINADRTEEDRVTGGAVVVTDVKTGEVLACASYPSYDLSKLSDNISDLLNNKTQPLYNRATMGTYNPGSTFKMVTALAGFKSGAITPNTTIDDTGVYMKYADTGFKPVCWIYTQEGHGHGPETIVTALRDSCNYFFYWLGDTIGIDAISSTASDFGLGAKTGIELPEAAGTLATPDTKKEIVGDDWYAADNIITAIGQDINYFTPVQLSNYVATIANGGKHYNLTILRSIRSADFSQVVYQPQQKLINTVSGSEYIGYLQQGMKLVASSGTAKSVFQNYAIPVAAKTGTVQSSATKKNAKLNNGIFVCYAPADDPQIAIALVVEKGTSGSTIMEIAKDIMTQYFKSQPGITTAKDNTVLP
ncbi:penicillin-binding transpeptidase domain-containing protein [Oscillospiraceae bacterium WX1]